MERTLTILTRKDGKATLCDAITTAVKDIEQSTYQGETLSFETPEALFARLLKHRQAMLVELLSAGSVGKQNSRAAWAGCEASARERGHAGRAWLRRRTDSGALLCPYADIHVDMHVAKKAA